MSVSFNTGEEFIVEKINFVTVKSEIEASTQESSVYIGCDSVVIGNVMTKFTTVILLHYNSNNGAKCFSQTVKIDRAMSIRERLMREVYFAVEFGLEIVDSVGSRNMEIHLDINPDDRYRSNIVMNEAVGFVSSQGLKVLTKPTSFAATSVADQILRSQDKFFNTKSYYKDHCKRRRSR